MAEREIERRRGMSGFVVIENDCGQYGPDDYEAFHRVLQVTEETTVGEILNWWRKNHPRVKEEDGLTSVLHLNRMDDA